MEPENDQPVEPPDLSHIVPALQQFAVPIDSIHLDPKNARLHGEPNKASIEASLAERGQTLPLTVRLANSTVMTGNGTLDVARGLGWTHIAAIFYDYTEQQAAAWAIAHNRTAELATWDYRQLGETMALFEEVDWEGVGYDPNELEAIIVASQDGVADHELPDNKDIDPDDIDDYEPEKDFFVIKVENVPPALKESAVAALNRALAEIGDGNLVARAY